MNNCEMVTLPKSFVEWMAGCVISDCPTEWVKEAVQADLEPAGITTKQDYESRGLDMIWQDIHREEEEE